MTTTTHKLTFSQVQSAIESDRNAGFCLACGEEASECEPDTRQRKCYACGEFRVFGAEQILIMGAFNDDDEKPLIAESLSRAVLDSGRMEIVHVGDQPAPEPAKKTPTDPALKPETVKALTIPQILKMNRQSRNVYFEKLARHIWKLTGILIGGGKFVIWTGKPKEPDFEVPEDDKIKTAGLLGSSDAILNRKTNFRLIPDIWVDAHDELLNVFQKRRMANDIGAHICFVNAVHFETCCVKSNVTHWRYSDQKKTGQCVIGFDSKDKPVCALMCIE